MSISSPTFNPQKDPSIVASWRNELTSSLGIENSIFSMPQAEISKEFYRLPYQNVGAKKQELEKYFSAAIQHKEDCFYTNVYANEPTRVKLKNDPHFYYNANWVLGGQAIAAMAPTQRGIGSFWQMVWYSETTTIVMLTNCHENEETKCDNYFPQNRSEEYGTSCGRLNVTEIQNTETILYSEGSVIIVKRDFLITHQKDTKTVSHYHLQNWPDASVVSEKTLANLVLLISAHVKEQKGPILAHCSAGIGRTGTFLACYEAYNRLQQGHHDPRLICDIVTELRDPEKGRDGMVQTEEQYELVYKTADYFIKYPASCCSKA